MAMGINNFSVAAQWRPLAEALLQVTVGSPAAAPAASWHSQVTEHDVQQSACSPSADHLHCSPAMMWEASPTMVCPRSSMLVRIAVPRFPPSADVVYLIPGATFLQEHGRLRTPVAAQGAWAWHGGLVLGGLTSADAVWWNALRKPLGFTLGPGLRVTGIWAALYGLGALGAAVASLAGGIVHQVGVSIQFLLLPALRADAPCLFASLQRQFCIQHRPIMSMAGLDPLIIAADTRYPQAALWAC